MSIIKKYDKIVALDFELYNSIYYWTICWVGVCVVDNDFAPLTAPFDIKVNPVVKKKHVGKDFTFPFTGAEIRAEKLFGEIADRFLQYIDENTLVIGHAFENDARMLIDACHKYNIKCPSFDFIDTNMLYNVVNEATGEHSLSTLAEEFEFEFTAHDPLEDARATLEIAKKLVAGDLYGYLQKYDIQPSRVSNSLIFRGTCCDYSAERNEKIARFNVAYNTSHDDASATKRFYFDNSLIQEQDLSAVAYELKQRGHSFVATRFASDVYVTNNLYTNLQYDVKSFRDLVGELKLYDENYDFSPKKVYGANNKPSTLDSFYENKYKRFEQSGDLNGKGVCFSKAVENGKHFDEICKSIVSRGGAIRFNVAYANIFIVNDRKELKEGKDGRVRFYNRTRKSRVVTVEEFLR